MEEQQIIMNKDTEIKEVKDQMRELADRLEALETVEVAPKRKPQRGEVWQGQSSKEIALITNDKSFVQRSNGAIFDVHGYFTDSYTYLGKAKDVLMLRSDVEKDYVSKKELRQWAYSLPCSQMNTALSRDWRRSDISIFKLID